MAKATINSTLSVTESVKIPVIGFGVYKSPTDVCVKSCLTALDAGYRLIDTAQFYDNEKEVGLAIQQSDVPRKDIFLTTKILRAAGSVDASYAACVESVAKLDPEGGYVDLFLIHSPNAGREVRRELWLALERLYREGKAKSIGVSNYGVQQMEEMKEFAEEVWPPHVNQIEASLSPLFHDLERILTCDLQLHPWCQQKEAVEYCEKNDIIIEAYCPIVRNQKANDETLVGIAKKHGVTANQVLIRYCLDKKWVPLPKSDNPERIKANVDVFGFELDEEDLQALDGLDQGASGAIVQAVKN